MNIAEQVAFSWNGCIIIIQRDDKELWDRVILYEEDTGRYICVDADGNIQHNSLNDLEKIDVAMRLATMLAYQDKEAINKIVQEVTGDSIWML